jgi:outer membrane protein OmpA-like peptidoglycan-associated protein
MMSVGVAALAQDPKPTPPPPQEPAGFVAGAVIGGLAAGPIGAVVGAGVGTWLGNRVHRADDARRDEARLAALEADEQRLQTEKAALTAETVDLTATNRALTARLDLLSQSMDAAAATEDEAGGVEAAKALDGLQGDVLFRTGSAEITPEAAAGIQVLAEAVAKSPALKVRLDGYADPRGTADANLKLSAARADAVRDLFLAAGVEASALEVNAYGKSRSTAGDSDGYALERRVRLTLQASGAGQVADATTVGATNSGGGLPVPDGPRAALEAGERR